jgi:hypothetical protein
MLGENDLYSHRRQPMRTTTRNSALIISLIMTMESLIEACGRAIGWFASEICTCRRTCVANNRERVGTWVKSPSLPQIQIILTAWTSRDGPKACITKENCRAVAVVFWLLRGSCARKGSEIFSPSRGICPLPTWTRPNVTNEYPKSLPPSSLGKKKYWMWFVNLCLLLDYCAIFSDVCAFC